MTTVFIPIESTRRELDYKINLARLFCNEGLDVVLGNPLFIRDELKYKNYKAIFIEKGANPEPSYYKSLLEKGIFLYDLSDEGATKPVYSINYQPAIDSLKCMRNIFLWGEAQKCDLLDRNPDKELAQKYNIIGSPAFDLCVEKYKTFHKGLTPKELPKSYILVNTNFGCYQSYTIREHLDACTTISPSSIQHISDSFEKEKKQFPVFKEWLCYIIESFPNQIFLIRPHPTEILENYEKEFGKYKNVIVSKEGNANQLIASAKLVLHKDCSTAMQSYLMGVPSISLGGQKLHKTYEQWPLAFSALPKTCEHAKRLVEDIFVTGQWSEDIKVEINTKATKILETNFKNVGNSSKTLVDFILKDAEDFLKEKTAYTLVDSRTYIQKLKFFVRKFLPLHYKIPVAARETMTKFSKKDVLTRLSLLESVSPFGAKFKVKKVFPNTFYIRKES